MSEQYCEDEVDTHNLSESEDAIVPRHRVERCAQRQSDSIVDRGMSYDARRAYRQDPCRLFPAMKDKRQEKYDWDETVLYQNTKIPAASAYPMRQVSCSCLKTGESEDRSVEDW